MSEEEKIEWATNHVAKSRVKVNDGALATSKRNKARKRLVDRERKKAEYSNVEIRKRKFGDEYNAKLRYLYKYNEEFRELKKYRVAFRSFQSKRHLYEAWTIKYYAQYKGKMTEKASTFRIEGTQNYIYGFTINDLVTYSPIKKVLITNFINENIIPAPKYRGHKWSNKTKKFNEHVEEFYLVEEIEEYLNIFARYKKKYTLVKHKEQKLFLKKNFWTKMQEVRNKFDND